MQPDLLPTSRSVGPGVEPIVQAEARSSTTARRPPIRTAAPHAIPAVPTALGGHGHSTSPDAATAGREAVLAALGEREAAAGDLVITFPSASNDLDELRTAAVEAAAVASVVGCTTVGAFTSELQVPAGCVATHIAGGELSFGVCHVERDDEDLAACTRRAAETARDRVGEEGLRLRPHRPQRRAHAGPARAGPRRLRGHERRRPDGGRRRRRRPALRGDDDVRRGPRTHERHPRARRLSERGAALLDAPTFGERAMERPIGLPNAHGRHDLRQIHLSTPDGGLVLTTGVFEQSVVQVMCSDDASLLEGAREAAPAAAAGLEGPARLVIVFSCCTRVLLLGERVGEEVERISAALGGAPAAGFYTCCEFGRVTGSTGIHNSSVAIIAF